MTKQNSFQYVSKIVLYIIAVLFPIWFIPFSVPVEMGREITFSILALIAAAFWILSLLTKNKLRFQKSPIIYGLIILLAVFAVSAIFSKAPILSFLLADPISERFSILVLGAIVLLVTSGVLQTEEEAGMMEFILIFSSAISSLAVLIQLFTGSAIFSFLSTPGVSGNDFNIVGTINGFAMLDAVMLVMSLGLLFSQTAKVWKPWIKAVLGISTLIFLSDLLLINFSKAWIAVFSAGLFLFALLIINRRSRTEFDSESSEKKFGWQYWCALLLLVVSLTMLFIQKPLFKSVNLPVEVSPSFSGTMTIASSVLKENIKSALLGSGPGTFGFDWLLYKDPSINQTIFWGVRFNQGFSWVATILATVGILGALAFLLFIIASFIVFLKEIVRSATRKKEAFGISLFTGFIASIIIAFLYPATFTLVFLFFVQIALISAILGVRKEQTEEVVEISETENEIGEEGETEIKTVVAYQNENYSRLNLWNVKTMELNVESSWGVFSSSLIVIFVLALGVSGIYMKIQELRVSLLQQSGASAYNSGDISTALADFQNAVLIDSSDYRNYIGLVKSETQQLQLFVQQAAQGQNVSNQFQSLAYSASQTAKQSTDLNPNEIEVWRVQAGLYELMIPFVPGAETPALASYQKAATLDPLNPQSYVDWGRAGLTYADRIQQQINQATGTDKNTLTQQRLQTLKSVETLLQKAVSLKTDYAQAHFLLAQDEIRLGDIKSAIKSTENAKLVAPFDVGIAFQLGLLYYQDNQIAKAQAEFERAVSLSQNYSNARYFLGLIYDKDGRTADAISQFEQIQKYNPTNQEVKNILANLKAGKPALAGISPPAQPPEKRSSVPINEKTSGSAK